MNASFAPQICAALARSFADQLSLRNLLLMACGVVMPKDAAKFGDRLLDAAMAAEEFLYNGYVIDYSK